MTDTVTEQHACGIDKPHPAHRYILGRRLHQCPGQPKATCCECGSTDVVYRNYLELPFCGPCANGDKPAATAPATTDLRDRLAAAIGAALDASPYWLPADGRPALVDAAHAVAAAAVDTEKRSCLPFLDRIGYAREWARRNLPEGQQHALFRILRGDTPTLDRPEPRNV